jgi:hypothetical protein
VSARLQAHKLSRGLFFEIIFLPPSGPRLTSTSRAPQFDKLTKRGKASDMSMSVRHQFSIPETTGAATQQICRAGRACSSRLMRHWESRSERARFMRDGAPRIDRRRRDNTMVDQRIVQSELGFVSHLQNSLSIVTRGAKGIGDLPKNCHLLPSTALLGPQNRYAG